MKEISEKADLLKDKIDKRKQAQKKMLTDKEIAYQKAQQKKFDKQRQRIEHVENRKEERRRAKDELKKKQDTKAQIIYFEKQQEQQILIPSQKYQNLTS
jgi:spore germination protein GerM